MNITVGVLALQGAFYEHIQLLKQARNAESVSVSGSVSGKDVSSWTFLEVRNRDDLSRCDALIIPGGESTTISLVAERSGLLDGLRDFVKTLRKPTWGTCAGLILLAESANRTKQGGQELIGGLDVRVNRNHFGRQVESFQSQIDLPFLKSASDGRDDSAMFPGVFIRAPVVERILPTIEGIQVDEKKRDNTVVAPSRAVQTDIAKKAFPGEVEVMATLPGRAARLATKDIPVSADEETGDIIAVRQGNVFGTSFHPELTNDTRIHVWWMRQVEDALIERRTLGPTT